MLKLAGYADRLSVRPGETIAFKLSNATGAPVRPELVRVICADPNPAGPGIREAPTGIDLADLTVAEHPVPRGSYATVSLGDTLAGLGDFTLVLTIQPTWLPVAKSAILAIEAGAGALSLTFDNAGRLEARLGDIAIATDPLPLKQWVDGALAFGQDDGRLSLATRPLSQNARPAADFNPTWPT